MFGWAFAQRLVTMLTIAESNTRRDIDPAGK